MKFIGLLESQRLASQLENGLQSETTKWKVPSFQGSTIKGTDISPSLYEQAVLWIEELRSLFHFYPETFFLAVNILNRILASVKAQAKYLRCISVTCLYLAAKANEEREIYRGKGYHGTYRKMQLKLKTCSCPPHTVALPVYRPSEIQKKRRETHIE
ncbi:cyclin-I2 isoform X2 [Pelobates fuscus]|uniref:cyclin-I2 isoform X2 n=1 Tax=Pelobates fuscus TaxID=191477 RepID=UPI002FE43EA8